LRVSFPWLQSSANATSTSAARRVAVAHTELRERAARLARLGYSPAATSQRLIASVAWDFDPSSKHGGPHHRPAGLSDDKITALVDDVYRRTRP
jgi:hypothetical protein